MAYVDYVCVPPLPSHLLTMYLQTTWLHFAFLYCNIELKSSSAFWFQRDLRMWMPLMSQMKVILCWSAEYQRACSSLWYTYQISVPDKEWSQLKSPLLTESKEVIMWLSSSLETGNRCSRQSHLSSPPILKFILRNFSWQTWYALSCSRFCGQHLKNQQVTISNSMIYQIRVYFGNSIRLRLNLRWLLDTGARKLPNISDHWIRRLMGFAHLYVMCLSNVRKNLLLHD